MTISLIDEDGGRTATDQLATVLERWAATPSKRDHACLAGVELAFLKPAEIEGALAALADDELRRLVRVSALRVTGGQARRRLAPLLASRARHLDARVAHDIAELLTLPAARSMLTALRGGDDVSGALRVVGEEHAPSTVRLLGALLAERGAHDVALDVRACGTDTERPPKALRSAAIARGRSTDDLIVDELEALVVAGDRAELVRVALANRRQLRRLVASASPVAADVLAALVPESPDLVGALAGSLRGAVPGWDKVVAAALDRGDEPLLRAVDDALGRWLDKRDADDAVARGALSCALVRTRLRRAALRRASGDFVGAREVLGRIGALPASAEETALALEWAMVEAELTAIDRLRVPADSRSRASLRRRLERAEPWLASVAEAAPSSGVAHALLGVLAVCRDDDEGIVAHLGAVVGQCRQQAEVHPELLTAGAFHVGLAELRRPRLIDGGGETRGYRRLLSSLDGGYRPPTAALVEVVRVLESHGSRYLCQFAERATTLAPSATEVHQCVCRWARAGRPDAIGLARHVAGLPGVRPASRCDLLLAALEGAHAVGDDDLALDVVVEIERVVHASGSAELTLRWAHALATSDELRRVVGADEADRERLDLLRLAGRPDEARAVAQALFPRVACRRGSSAALEPEALVDLIQALGASDEDVRRMRAQLPTSSEDELDEPASRAAFALERPVTVLFVGGNETQARYHAAVELAMTERYNGRVRVEWFTTGWHSNWHKEAARVESRYRDADVIVLMTFVRTTLGERLRRSAGEAGLPWVACTGHGRAAIERAIDEAARLAASPLAERTI